LYEKITYFKKADNRRKIRANEVVALSENGFN